MKKDQKASFRYAEAFFTLMGENKLQDKAHDELATILHFCSTHKELERLFITSTISYEEKEGLINNIFDGLSVQTKSFLKLLVRKQRFPLFFEITSQVKRLYHESQGIEEAKVVSAFPIDEKLANQVKDTIGSYTDKKVTLIVEVDPTVIGGIAVYTQGLVIDSTLKNKLDELKKNLIAQRG